MRKRTIIGVQLHHSVQLADATRGGANMLAGLAGAVNATDDPALKDLHAQGIQVLRAIGRAERAATERLRALHESDPIRFYRCRDGFEPWPDETVDGFEARCTCGDICRIHQDGRSAQDGWVCNCCRCPRHPEADRAAA